MKRYLKRTKIQLGFALISLITSVFVFLLYEYSETTTEAITFAVLFGLLATISLLTFARILYSYLQTGQIYDNETNSFDIEESTDEEIEIQLEKFFNEKGREIIGETITNQVEARLRQRVSIELNNRIEIGAGRSQATQFDQSDIKEYIELLSDSLVDRVAQINRAKSTNLVVGISISIVAIALLSISYLSSKPSSPSNVLEFLSLELPRVTLAVLVELIGFFFLRMYKSTHNDLKYYQNELTNIRSWSLGLVLASKLGDLEVQKECIKKILSVERNFLLKSGETTSQLELEKLDSVKSSEIASMLKDLISSQGKKQNEG